MATFQLYSYYRSSSSYRVRAALHLKSLPYEYKPIHLVKDGGEQHSDEFKKINPMGEVPVLIHRGKPLTQSMAIIQYLDEVDPRVRLFPKDSYKRAKVLEFCEIINSGIQPIQNLKVLQKLQREFKIDKEETLKWGAYWIIRGFQGVEILLEGSSGKYCFGDSISAADVFLCPQVYNARRFNVDLDMFPNIKHIEKNCLDLRAFQDAYPEFQPDTPSEELRPQK